ncbi:G-protein coupled receptor GRL101-like [Ruditapes philippinarum]|uniref:G-protein coupled receptor GRL101-like n=1 Tax=Ruditapes philippinarum TaxID=129788 RepID=UPI00295C23F2|nr:G-protein coupled receptor GRL101-like [Ruditapes philippinarum]
MTGCRSGIHLQDCEDFVCPPNTVKCPDSFCIALRFVCDGMAQCPGEEDEHNCSCVSGDKEVIILIEDTKQQISSKRAAALLAKQFKHGNNKVRILSYQAKTRLDDFPLIHRLLEIREENIDSFDALSSDCTYKTMARNFLPSLQFKNDVGKFLIFIEDSVESSTVARIMFSNIYRPEFTIYRVIRNFSFLTNLDHTYEFVKDVRINKWSSLHSIGYRHFPEICKEVSHVPCAGGFRCLSSKQCIPLHQVCDGIVHCMNKDDEQMCGFRCHYKCNCVDSAVDCRKANLTISDIHDLSRRTRSADLSYNYGITDILSKENIHFPFMLFLDVSNCRIEVVSSMAFSDINNLLKLNISHNIIKKLSDNVFRDLRHLVELDLDGNSELEEISASAFQGLQSIKTLRISGTKLKKIATLTFSNLKLESIDISNNEIREIENFAFNNTSVKKINFEGNNILEFHQFIFSDVVALIELRTPAYKFCCIRPCYVKESNCYPSKNEFSSCDDLMRHPILQAVLWLVGIASLLGNLASIVYRVVYDRQRLKIGYGIFVTNLASADFLMGIYLIVIAFIDTIYRGRYIYMDDQWRNSIWCTLTGFLSTVSSEASVFFLCLITIDRLLVIKYPFGHVRFTPMKAYICCLICWIIAVSLAVIPIIHTGYFKNKFYSRSGVCIALPLSRDKPPGWMYSVSIFVGLNFSTFILVAFGQLSIFLELRKSSMVGKKTQKSRKRDLQVAKNLILVATTDFLCWFPIGLMGILSLNGYTISGDVYAFTAVFILPFNSALNPFLYTLSAIIGKKSFNPSLDEQSRTEMQKEIGSAILNYTDFSRSVITKREIVPDGKTRRIKDVLDDDENMSVASVTAISYHLANYLSLLHESSVGIEELSETNTFIPYGKKKAKNPIIVLDTKMTLAIDDRKKADNIYQYGCLLRKMITRCKANDKTIPNEGNVQNL